MHISFHMQIHNLNSELYNNGNNVDTMIYYQSNFNFGTRQLIIVTQIRAVVPVQQNIPLYIGQMLSARIHFDSARHSI